TGVLFARQAAIQTGELKIVVLDGADGVNIIDRKTAVVPVVGGRDKNDLPVAAVIVTFVILGRGSFYNSGAKELTVRTDQAGRAIANGLTPDGKGPLQILVRAVDNGVVATTTIHQTNYATEAEAAQAAKPAASAPGGPPVK